MRRAVSWFAFAPVAFLVLVSAAASRAAAPIRLSGPLIVGQQPHCLAAAGQDLPVACVVVSGEPLC